MHYRHKSRVLTTLCEFFFMEAFWQADGPGVELHSVRKDATVTCLACIGAMFYGD